MSRYRVLSWRGIPMQVKVVDGSHRPVSRLLPPWFGEHVDRVAMRDGLSRSDAYLDQLQWSAEVECDGTPDEIADAVVAQLEADWAPVQRRWAETGELE